MCRSEGFSLKTLSDFSLKNEDHEQSLNFVFRIDGVIVFKPQNPPRHRLIDESSAFPGNFSGLACGIRQLSSTRTRFKCRRIVFIL
ncbi:hypothetical protein L1887_36425 [Cichorium endivia]|nr:hypothetical protein L1887_36425 [Cichorium endivia]